MTSSKAGQGVGGGGETSDAAWRRARDPVKAGAPRRSGGDPTVTPDPGAPPDASRLRALALAHLARFETTEAGLRRVLERAVGRWARAAARAGLDGDAAGTATAGSLAAIESVIRAMAASSLVDDRRFAERRAGLDRSGGRSARASRARMQGKGVAPDLAAAVTVRDDAAELAAALLLLRRRRLGPFGSDDEAADPDRRRRTLAMLARGGFAGPIARRAIAMTRDEAERAMAEA